jgi:hypothetical protein
VLDASVQLVVGELLLVTDHCNGVWALLDLGCKQLMQTPLRGRSACGVVPFYQQVLLFCGG